MGPLQRLGGWSKRLVALVCVVGLLPSIGCGDNVDAKEALGVARGPRTHGGGAGERGGDGAAADSSCGR